MNQDETLALFAQGKDAWNAWAAGMLERRKALEAAGTWAAMKGVLGRFEPQNDETRAWMDAAAAVFSTDASKHTFEQAVDCIGWTFPGAARFGRATFTGDARFDKATFTGGAWFREATFTGDAGFEGAKFIGAVGFVGATFKRIAFFNKAIFEKQASFEKATFSGDAVFHNASFHGDAIFGAAAFAIDARFKQATFVRDAGFGRVKFNGYTDFSEATFQSTTSFSGSDSKSAFTLKSATFGAVPDFIQANFVQAPRLDNMVLLAKRVAEQSNDDSEKRAWKERIQAEMARRRDIPARYRALKRLAIQGHDFEREQMFHAGEIRASRFSTDWPLPWKLRLPRHWRDLRGWLRLAVGLAFGWLRPSAWASVWRFWFGLAYGLLSDFGRSVLRPAIAWALLLAWSAMLYLGANPDMAKKRAALLTDRSWATLAYAYAKTTAAAWATNQPCVADGEGVRGLPEAVRAATSAVNQALRLAIANGAVLGDIGSPDTGTRTYGCLYGLAPASSVYGLPGVSTGAITPYPDLVASISMLQRAASAVLLFLFGLAVRNMLKMK